jgi:hypothetical protein
MLVHKAEGKEQDTPASAIILCYSACRAAIETRPDKPHRTWLVAELGQPMAEYSRQACVARRGRWGPLTPCERNERRIKQKNYFLNGPNFYARSLARQVPFHHAE